MIVAAVLALALWVAGLLALRRTEPTRMPAARRVAIGTAALAVLLAFPLGFYLAPSQPPVDALPQAAGGA